jgi:hypothetical protein
VTWLSMSPQHPDAAWDSDMPDVLRILEQPGCVLCRICEEAARTWVRWFGMENHNDPALLHTVGESAVFCPARTRRLVAETSAPVLRPSLTFTLGGAIGRAERTAARHGQRGSQAATSSIEHGRTLAGCSGNKAVNIPGRCETRLPGTKNR